MLSSVSRSGASRLCSILCFALLLLLVSPFNRAAAQPFVARGVGDFHQIAVIEISGNFDALDSFGQINSEPRRALAREFYRSHGDDYDFLVYFTNFDVRMPTIQAKAFFSPARNNVQGVGLPLYDQTEAYSADGLPLQRLEGTIDMGSHAAHVLEPADPRFETTLRVLTHELLHRWGAYVRFLDAGIESDALLGLDKAHWSFLLDSGGSTLYGNRWQNNGNGTFTALTPESAHPGELFGRLLNPLELYLMGFAGPEEVPPLQLLEAPGLDPAQLPAPGVTIPGELRTVTIDEIIALEGPRIPAAAESRKELRVGFVLAVAPGSFNAADPATVAALTAIGRLRGEWEKRFAILTDGHGRLQTGLVQELPVESNPVVTEVGGPLAAAASVDAAVNWLVEQQSADGRWEDQPGTALRDTSAAVKALSVFPSAAVAVARGKQWLQMEPAANHDFQARQQVVLANGSNQTLLAEVNEDGGWGGQRGFRSNPLDTALAVQALAANGVAGSPIAAACNYLHNSQQADGGWCNGSGPSHLFPTCAALLALNEQRRAVPLEAAVAEARNWLMSARNGDGGFGQPTSNAVETALALQSLKVAGAASVATLPAMQWLQGHQLDSGSWQGSAHATALALQALYTMQIAPDLTLSGADVVFDPPLLAMVPGEVLVKVTVHNLGSAPVANATLALYAGDSIETGVLLAEQMVSVAGNGTTQATFVVSVASAGVHRFYMLVDAANEIDESDEWNNTTIKSLTAELSPPLVGFTAPTSAIAEGVGKFVLPAELSHPWHEPVVISYVVGEGSDAVAGVDYRTLTGTLAIPAGETVASITIELIDDLNAEADERLTLVLSSVSSGTIGQGRHELTILDDELPTLAIASPQATVIGSPTPRLLFETTAARVQVLLDGEPVDARSGNVLGPLADGVHQLEVTAINSLGGSHRQQVSFSIDTTLPVVAILSPLPGLSSDPAPLLTYTVGTADGYNLSLDGKVLTKGSGERLDPLADGEHRLSLSAWNAAGAQVTTDVRFTIDSSPPELEIIYPNNDVLREVSPRLFCQLAGASATTVRLDDVPTGSQCGDSLGPLADGAHSVEVTATDAAGNRTTKRARFIVYTGAEQAYPVASGWSINAARYFGGVAVDSLGNVYLATQDAGYSLTIQKYTSDGVLVWQRRPFVSTLIPRDAAVDAAGNLFVVGYNSYGDGFLYKFASMDGAYLSGHAFVSAGSDYAFAVQIDSDGQVVVAGDTGGDLYGYPNGTMNIWIARLDNDCRLLNGRQLTLSGMQEMGGRGGLVLDQAGNAYLAGYTDAATFGPNLGGDDAFVVKFDKSLWPSAPLLQFGTNGNDQALDVAVDIYGNIYVGGVSVETSHYFEKGFVYKFDAAGNLLKQAVIENQPVNGLACERDGTVYALNDFGTLEKYDHDLNLLWRRGIGWNYRYNLAMDPSGDLYTGGDGGTLGSYASVVKLIDVRRPAITLDATQLLTRRDSVVLGGTLTVGANVELLNPELRLLEPINYSPLGRWQMAVGGLSEGATTMVLEATSQNGFRRQVKAELVVDVTPPQVVISTPADGQLCSARTSLVYSVSDGQVEVLVNGVKVYKSSGQLLEALRPGWNTIRVEATDAAGNTGADVVRVFAEGEAVGEMPLNQAAFSQQGTVGDETVVAAASDASGNLYLMGYTTGSFPGYVNAGGRDPYIAKFDALGRPLATWQLGSSADEAGGGFAIDASGNLVATWNVRYVNSKGQADYAVRVVKMSGSGTLLWQTELNSSANDQVYDLSLTANGDVLLGGETYGSLDRQRYGGAGDYFLAKYSATGSKLWVRLSNAADGEALHALAVDASGAVYGIVRVGAALAGVPVPNHLALVKFDPAGTLLKVDPLALPGSDFSVRDLLCDADGRLLVAGANGSRYFLAAHDLNLVSQWLVVSPVEESVVLAALAIDPAGNLYVGGHVTGSFAGNRAFGGSDGVIIRHTPGGSRQWSLQYGSAGHDYIGGMVPGRGGELWIGGHTDGLLGESRAGLSDAYLARFTQPQALSGPPLSIDPHAQLINTSSLHLSGMTAPGAVVEITSGSLGLPHSVNVDGEGRWSTVITGLQPDAENLLTISARNELGTTRMTVAITVDTVAPLLTVDPPANPIQETSLVLSGSVEQGAAVTLVSFSGEETISSVDGTWCFQVSGLQTGDNLLTVTATDAAGNVAMQEVVIRYLPPPPPTVSISPAVIGALQATDIVLSIDQVVPAGSTVTISRVLDLNGNGHAENDEPVTDRFTVTDGFQPDPFGRSADSDGVRDGRISVGLNGHFVNDRLHAPGEYLYVVTAGGGSARAGFTVLAEPRPQSISGTIRDQAGSPLAGVLVELTDPWEYSYGFAYSDQGGHYRFDVAVAGDYQLRPNAPGHVSSRRFPAQLHLTEGVSLSTDLTVLAGTWAISGTVRDMETLDGLVGVVVRAVGDDYQAVATSGLTGDYTLQLPAGSYQLFLSGAYGDGLTEAGYLAGPEAQSSLVVTADAAGIDLAARKAASFACGEVRTAAGVPVAGVPVESRDPVSAGFSQTVSDGDGRYCVGRDGASGWVLGHPGRLLFASGWLGSEGAFSGSGDLTVYPLDARIGGTVTDGEGQPLAGIPVSVRHPLGPVTAGKTSDDGSYRLGLASEAPGGWTLLADGQPFGYLPQAISLTATPGADLVRNLALQKPVVVNTIVITKASYDPRKKTLTVEATSNHPEAQLQVEGFGAMTYVRLFKGKYYWSLTRSVAVKPVSVTVSGVEGRVTAPVQ